MEEDRYKVQHQQRPWEEVEAEFRATRITKEEFFRLLNAVRPCMKSSKMLALLAVIFACVGLLATILSWFNLYTRPLHYLYFAFWALFLCTTCVVEELERRP